jgi:hypothetical protein
MAAQFITSWDNTVVAASGNALTQTISYRKRLTGGAFITTGFTPSNPLAKTDNTASTANTLSYNSVYQFLVQANCTVNGPSINSNGIVEQVRFFCIAPTLVIFDTKVRITLDVTDTDVIKARFNIRKESDDTLVQGPNVVNRVGNSIFFEGTGLIAETAYYIQIELYVIVSGVEVVSSASTHLNDTCNTDVTTGATTECPAPESLTITYS